MPEGSPDGQGGGVEWYNGRAAARLGDSRTNGKKKKQLFRQKLNEAPPPGGPRAAGP